MFLIRERSKLQPLATQGPFKRDFVVEVAFNVFKLSDGARVTLFGIDDDGLEKKLAEGTYMLDPKWVEKVRDKIAEESKG